MALAFPALADHVFENAPLVVVLTQVRFPPILALLAEPGAAGFQEAIRETYPTMTKIEDVGVLLGPTTVQAQRQAPVWQFTNSDKQWVVTLSVDFIAFETPAYTHADDFLTRFDRILDALDRTVHPARSLRVGLRKVNQLVAAHQDAREWQHRLNPKLVGLLSDQELPGEVRFLFSDLRLGDENGDELAVRHGVIEGTPTKYRMDLDYSTERPFEIKAGSDLTALLRSYALSETQFFVWSLGEELHANLGPLPRPTREESE